VREYWIVDPEEKAIKVMTLGKTGFESFGTYGKRDILKSSIFSGLNISLSEVF